jgi:hypothetical protein
MTDFKEVKKLEETFFSAVIEVLDNQQKELIDLIEQTKIETINEMKLEIKETLCNQHPCVVMLEKLIKEINQIK